MASPTSKSCFTLNEARYANVWGYVREKSIPRCGHLNDTADTSHTVENLQSKCQINHDKYMKWQTEMNFLLLCGYFPFSGPCVALHRLVEVRCPLQFDINKTTGFKVVNCTRGIFELFLVGSLCFPIDVACCCYREKCSHDPTGGMLIKKTGILKAQSTEPESKSTPAKSSRKQNYAVPATPQSAKSTPKSIKTKPRSPSADRK